MTFKELYLSGQIEFDEIDRYISRWNRSDDERTLAKYLGLNAEEEDVWIDDSDEALQDLLDSYERVKGTPVTLGKTGIIVNKNGFGALPIQRIGKEEAAVLLKKAYDGGIRYFDTARAYSDSEEKIGYALKDVRSHIYIATKTMASTPEKFWEDLETSLRLLQTDYIDVYQLHNPPVCPKPGDETGCTTPCWRQRNREKSGLSALLTTGSTWRRKRWSQVSTIRFSSRSTTCLPRGRGPWQRNAGKRIWASSP